VYYIGFSLGESDTIKVNASLRQNIVMLAHLVTSDDKELRLLFGDLDKGIENGLIHKCIDEAKALYAEGKVETLVLDTVTYLVEYLWQYVNKFCEKKTYSGEIDKRGLFGELNTMLVRLIGLRVVSFPGNLVLTAHEMLESDEAMEKKPDKSTAVVSSILGGFRNKIEGMVSMVLFLQKVEKGGQYAYWARTNKGNSRNAKSRLPIPTTVENISYSKIMAEVQKAINQPIKGGEIA